MKDEMSIRNNCNVRSHRFVKYAIFCLLVFNFDLIPIIRCASATDYKKGLQSEAIQYINYINSDRRILVFPNKNISYQAVGIEKNISQSSIERYTKITGNHKFDNRPFWLPQISIVVFDSKSDFKGLKSVIIESRIMQSYKNIVLNYKLNSSGCTSLTFDSRKTWLAAGVVLLDSSKIMVRDIDIFDDCIHSSLDIFQGFPLDANAVAHRGRPSIQIRRLILDAIQRCYTDPVLRSQDAEISRDGISALPSMECIKDLIFKY